MRVLISSKRFSETFLNLRRTERDMIKMSNSHHLKYPLFLAEINETLIFSTVFPKIPKHHIS
jgi:hypothetical protein